MQNLTPEAYGWLVPAFLIAVIVDLVVVRVLLDVLRPPSAYVFWTVRAGKLAGLLAAIGYVNVFWYPRFAGGGGLPAPLRLAEVGLVIGGILLAVATLPRSPFGKRDGHA